MGQEIPNSRFSEDDFRHYQKMLEDESALLKQWFDGNCFIDELQYKRTIYYRFNFL